MLGQKEAHADQFKTSLSLSTKLEIVGSTLNLFGEALSTAAILIALEEEKVNEQKNQQERNEQEKQIKMMQRQINELKKEIEQLK